MTEVAEVEEVVVVVEEEEGKERERERSIVSSAVAGATSTN